MEGRKKCREEGRKFLLRRKGGRKGGKETENTEVKEKRSF